MASQASKPSSPSHYLVYLIAQQRLYGIVNGKKFDLKAFSGGGRGSVAGKDQHSEATFDYRIKKISKEFNERGGPIPPGTYSVLASEKNGTLGQANKLVSLTAHLKTKTRDYGFPGGFYIHGKGRYGSDGCIVPDVPAQRSALVAEIDKVAPFKLWVQLIATTPSRKEILKAMVGPVIA